MPGIRWTVVEENVVLLRSLCSLISNKDLGSGCSSPFTRGRGGLPIGFFFLMLVSSAPVVNVSRSPWELVTDTILLTDTVLHPGVFVMGLTTACAGDLRYLRLILGITTASAGDLPSLRLFRVLELLGVTPTDFFALVLEKLINLAAVVGLGVVSDCFGVVS
jgi:hypothetical protein